MDARNLTAIPHSDAGSLEVIVPDGDAAIRWSSHGYPSSLAKWHYHPQIEIHLIREGSGQLMAGDGLMPFVPGHVAMIGIELIILRLAPAGGILQFAFADESVIF